MDDPENTTYNSQEPFKEQDEIHHRHEGFHEDEPTQLTTRVDAAGFYTDSNPNLERKFDQYGKQIKTLSGINSMYNTVAPILLTFVFWNGRSKVDLENCTGPGYSWSLYAMIYYAIYSLLELRGIAVKFAEKRDWNMTIFTKTDIFVKLFSCLMYPVSIIISFVLILALLWSDTCPDLTGTLLTWFIVQLCSWLSCCLCCGLGGYSGFNLIRQEVNRTEEAERRE
jgi:hypothetical protein